MEKVRKSLAAAGEPAFRLRQALDAVFKNDISSWEEARTLPPALRERLNREAPVLSGLQERVLVSADGRAHKAALRLHDGALVETVLLRPKPEGDWSVCVSTQVGCAMACTFCATGLMGLRRNMSGEEISDQVLFWRGYIKARRLHGRLSNVVYMGMGEPMHNYAAVSQSLTELLDPERYGLSGRHISVSTVGLVPGIERFIEDFPTVNLALSLHAATDSVREKMVPATRAFPVAALADVLRKSLAKTGRKIFLEYVLLDGENDRIRDSFALAKFVHSVGRADLLHVNLIVWNPTATRHQATEADNARRFKVALERQGVSVTIRRNLGTDIQGACGQLITRLPPPRSAPREAARPAREPRTGERPRSHPPKNRKRPEGGGFRPLS
ncbi:MAG: 23S rRNA (adenine(2503)-C(2))-methyltransferase RlmN [Elusimicrobia bacterium]|nr:23S rRNA (adenine(2503)-C(2))-methyltransferase RlmN [Elusimicrobiota bacterium]